VDAELRQLFDELQRRHFLDGAVIVITADHGEEFHDHSWMSHGTALYNESIHVPLILQGAGIPVGRVVEENVSLVDVAPTLLALAGLAPEPRFEGRSLAPLFTQPSALVRVRNWFTGDRSRESPDILVELERTQTSIDFRRHTAGIIRGAVKVVVNENDETSEMYHLEKDPGEHHPVVSSDGEAGEALARALANLRATLQKRKAAREERGPLDQATKDRLRALGYQF